MPNGHRIPYRLESGVPPSPSYTSDSDTIAEEKNEWRARQVYNKAIANKLFPMVLMHHVDVLVNIARFLNFIVSRCDCNIEVVSSSTLVVVSST